MLTRPYPHLVLALLLAAVLTLRPRVASSAPPGQQPEPQGQVEIISPRTGDTIRGLVQILGTAIHPDFNNYVVEFGFDPNVDDQWFPVQEPVAQQVQNGPLAVWDTTVIADGPYQLRLRVVHNDGTADEFTMPGIAVANAVPTLLPTIAPSLTPTLGAPTPGPSPTSLIQQPPTRTPRPTPTPGGPTLTPTPNPNVALTQRDLRAAVCRGVVITGLVFSLLAVYSFLRAHARAEIRRWWKDFRREVLGRSGKDQ